MIYIIIYPAVVAIFLNPTLSLTQCLSAEQRKYQCFLPDYLTYLIQFIVTAGHTCMVCTLQTGNFVKLSLWSSLQYQGRRNKTLAVTTSTRNVCPFIEH